MNESLNYLKDGQKKNETQILSEEFTGYMTELEKIEKFVTDQLKDPEDRMRDFRLSMFARHFEEVFVLSGLLKNIQNAIENKNEGLKNLIYEMKNDMSFFRMFLKKDWEPPT